MIYFTSDTHFDHANIIKYANRPFTNITEMNVALVQRWNEKVGPSDTVYHLGDFSFSKDWKHWINLLLTLNGGIHLVKGNHDKDKLINQVQKNATTCGFLSVSDYKYIKIQEGKGVQEIVLMHYAMRVWNKSHYGAWQLYGHSHNNLPPMPNSKQIDVGVDSHNFYPISYEEIKEKMSKVEGYIIDHHGNKTR